MSEHSTPQRRLLVANFDCELRFAQQSAPGPHKELPPKVRKALALVAPALRALASPMDALWTMAPEVVGDEGAGQLSGPLAELPPFDAILPWGQTSDLPSPLAPARWKASDPWQEQLWHLRSAPAIAAACNDRRLCLEIEIDPQWILGDRQVVESLESLDEYIATRPLGPAQTWVAKAPWAASGRERVRRRGRVLDGEMRVRTGRLIERYGALVIEGWMERLADYGVAGIVGEEAEGICIFPPHQLHSDDTGVFRGIRIADRETEEKLGPEFHRALHSAATLVAQALFQRGYRGPFGIDAFVYTDSAGQIRLQSLCEINARLCFGLVARAQAARGGLSTFDFSF